MDCLEGGSPQSELEDDAECRAAKIDLVLVAHQFKTPRHADAMTASDNTKATSPTGHQPRGQAIISTALLVTSGPADNHNAPISREIGCVTCGRLAYPTAFAYPLR